VTAVATPLERDAPGCVYTASAVAPVATPTLAADLRVDALVIGAGFTGLSAALHLAERGREVALLEAHEPGWGAAGRNGGQVNAGLKHEPDVVERDFGPVHGPRLVRLAGSAPDILFGLVERYRIDCEARRAGTLRAAYQPRHASALRDSVEQWRRRGVAMEYWDAGRIAAATGTRRYVAATFDPRGGSVNPLSLARGLAAAAQRAGARIFGATRAHRLDRDGRGWRVVAPGGTVWAERVVLATDGYSDGLWPDLRSSIVPIYSSIIATAPLPPALAASILPTGSVLYEAGNITVYYRRDRDGRLLMGGRGRQSDTANRADYEHLVRYARRLWPDLASVEWTHWWNGQFALTPNFYPRWHSPAPNIHIALGYSGRGVALGTAMGAELAAAVTGEPVENLTLPVIPIRRLRFHRFWPLGVAAGVIYGRIKDRLGR
jgi:glycine/D-amino acid oxidase-like deaminating enzyme